jgi:hypothetical protein
MLFRGRRREPSRREQWRAFARRLELTDAQPQEARLREWLDLGDSALEPLYGLRRTGQPTLFLFDQERARSGPTGSVTTLATGVLLRATAPLAAASLRAQARRNPVLESIEAGRTGSRRLTLTDLPGFDAEVSVFARDEDAVRAWLRPAVQRAMQRMLVDRDVSPALVVGNRHMLVLCEGPQPAPFEALEALSADLFTLFAMADTAAGATADAPDGGPDRAGA